jgi:PAS domain S-box-containing protein
MPQPPLPPRETERLFALYRYEILDTPPEKELDDLVHLASYICRTPIAVISLIDSDRQWFKSKIGLTATQTDRIVAFCSHTILGPDLLVVPDALADARFADNPLVTGDPHIRFYCGAPLSTPEGYQIGTLSVIDHVPRELSSEQLEALRVLSRQVMEHLTLDRQHRELIQAVNDRGRAEQALQASEAMFRTLSETTSSGIYIYRGDRFLYANSAAVTITGYTLHELRAMSLWDLVHPAFYAPLKALVQAVAQGDHAPARLEFQIVRKDGGMRWVDFTAASIEFEGQPARIGTAYDITDRKEAEELREVQRRVLEMVSLNNPLAETMDFLVQSIESLSDGAICTILLVDPGSRTLRRGAVSTLPEAFCRAVDGAPIGPQNGSCGTAAYRKTKVVVADIATDPLWAPWPEARALALRHGLKACTSIPILSAQDEVLGTYAMYYRAARGPTEFEVEQLRASSQLLGIAIQRARSIEALRASEQRMEAILDNSPLMVFLKDRDERYLFTNRTFELQFGLSSRQAIGKTDAELFPHDQAKAFQAHDQEVFRSGAPLEFEEVARYEDGEHTSIVVKFPLRSPDGAIYAVCGIVTDVTERKRAEEGARRWQQVFSKAKFGLAYGSVIDNSLVAVNEAFARERGYTVDELVGKPILSVYAPEAREAQKARMPEIDRLGRMVYESVHQRKDGTTFPVLMEVTVIKDAEGRPISRVAYALDIADRNRAVEELQEAYRRLQVLSREVQIAQEQERNRLSRELHDEFGQLLSALKFDLSDVAKGVTKKPPLATTALQKKIGAATFTVDRLFASLREMVHALRSAVLEELGLVPALETLANETHERSGLRCRVVADRDALGKSFGPEFESTLYRMAQELLTNVVRHAKATSATITISRTGGWMKLAVQDNGRGFKISSVQPKARFGLLGVQERAELLGGNVEIHSEPGKGTVVTVRIPIEPSSPGESSVASSRLSKSVAARKRGRHGKQV